MLIILLSWIYILGISFLWGHMVISLLSYLFKTITATNVHFALYSITGLVFLSTVTAYFSLFVPVGYLVQLFIAGVAIFYLVSYRKKISGLAYIYAREIKSLPGIIYIIFIIALFVGLCLSAIAESKFDHGLYYQQIIKWIESYPVIPGLGNLHLKLSFNSTWHILSALFSFSYFGIYLDDLNGLLHVVFTIYALSGVKGLLNHDFKLSNAFKIVMIFPLHVMVSNLLSPAPDLVIPYLVWIIIILFLEKIENASLPKFDLHSFLILIFSLFAITVKLSAAPIAILPISLFIIQLSNKNSRLIIPYVGLTILIIVPWVIRNVVISGYLVYPFYQLDILSVDWKIPSSLVQLEVAETKAFAKIRGIDFNYVNSLSMSEWLPVWWKELRPSQLIILAVNIIISIYIFYLAYSKLILKEINLKKAGYIILILTIYTGILFWFFTAPRFRYGMAFNVGLYILGGSYLLYYFYQRYQSTYVINLTLALIIFFYSKPVYDTISQSSKFEENIYIFPVDNKILPELNTVLYSNIDIFVPENSAQCWGAPLPCAPFVVDGLQVRSANIKDGFRITNPKPEAYYKKRLKTMGLNY